MYSNFSCFENSSFSASFFVASLAYVHGINCAVHLSFFFLDLNNFFLSGHPGSFCLLFHSQMGLLESRNKIVTAEISNSLKAAIFRHSQSNFQLNLKTTKSPIQQNIHSSKCSTTFVKSKRKTLILSSMPAFILTAQ